MKKIIASALALSFLGSYALSCEQTEFYSVGHTDARGEVWVEDYNLTKEDCAAWQDDDSTWECWLQDREVE